MQFLRGLRGAGAARTERSVAERVVWERRAPATTHGAPLGFFIHLRTHICLMQFFTYCTYVDREITAAACLTQNQQRYYHVTTKRY